ncbi:MAG: 50S ribosomal protein L31 [Rhodothermaceae bacterium]|nr:50S ribosomal protein L31 [Rhodothermaceae bacterium]
MKNGIHPDYDFMTVKLADGTTFTTRSTMGIEQYNSEVDSSNHPFYTGKRTMVDTAGRVEKFRRRYGIKDTSSESEDG